MVSMAIVQYTGLVNQIRGKLNGSVFNKARNVNTLQRKQQAPRRGVGFQSEPRNIFSSAQRSWRGLTGTQRTQWALAAVNNPSRDRFGNLVALSGYNQYIKAFMFASYAGTTPPETPDTNPAPYPDVTLFDTTELSFSLSPQGSVVYTNAGLMERGNADSGFFLLGDVGLPSSAGVTVYYGRFSFFLGTPVDDDTEWDVSQNLGPRFPLPAEGQPYWYRFRLVYVPNGSVVWEFRDFTDAQLS